MRNIEAGAVEDAEEIEFDNEDERVGDEDEDDDDEDEDAEFSESKGEWREEIGRKATELNAAEGGGEVLAVLESLEGEDLLFSLSSRCCLSLVWACMY